MTFLTAASVMFDAIYVPGGAKSVAALQQENEAINFIAEAFKHCKAIAASSEGIELLTTAGIMSVNLTGTQLATVDGVVTNPPSGDLKQFGQAFIAAMMPHRHWARAQKQKVLA
jgi:catalase